MREGEEGLEAQLTISVAQARIANFRRPAGILKSIDFAIVKTQFGFVKKKERSIFILIDTYIEYTDLECFKFNHLASSVSFKLHAYKI